MKIPVVSEPTDVFIPAETPATVLVTSLIIYCKERLGDRGDDSLMNGHALAMRCAIRGSELWDQAPEAGRRVFESLKLDGSNWDEAVALFFTETSYQETRAKLPLLFTEHEEAYLARQEHKHYHGAESEATILRYTENEYARTFKQIVKFFEVSRFDIIPYARKYHNSLTSC
ncbi:hypothetical protein JCM11641_008400 [Rhodosporidiobolus odoratus]